MAHGEEHGNSAHTLESFFVALGFEVELEELEKFEHQVAGITSKLGGLVEVAAVAAAAVAAFVFKISEGVEELFRFGEREKISIALIQELGYAAEQTGGSVEAVKSSISGLNEKLGEAARGLGRGAMIFRRLGFEARDSNGHVKKLSNFLYEVSDHLQKMSRPESLAAMRRLGMDTSLLPLLLRGREGIKKLREEARDFGIVSKESAEKATELGDAVKRLGFVSGQLSKIMASELAPSFQKNIDLAVEWIHANKALIQSGVEKFVGVLGNVFKFFADTVELVINDGTLLLDLLTGIQSKGAAVGVMLAALTVWLFPIAALVVAIGTTVALLIDDFEKWRTGGESLIGDFLSRFPQIGETFSEIWTALHPLVGALKKLFAALYDLASVVGQALLPLLQVLGPLLSIVGKILYWIAKVVVWVLVKLLTELTEILTGLVVALTWAFSKMVQFFSWIGDKISEGVNHAIARIEMLIGKLKSAAKAVGEFFGVSTASTDGGGAVSEAGVQRGAIPGIATGARLAFMNSPLSPQIHTTNVEVGGVTVISPDAAKAGVAVKNGLNDATRRATRNGQGATKL